MVVALRRAPGRLLGRRHQRRHRSGTQQLPAAPAYYFFRNEALVGDGPDRRSQLAGTFSDKQFGASLGGPIVKDKAFFFVNVDCGGARRRPASPSTAPGQTSATQAEVQRFVEHPARPLRLRSRAASLASSSARPNNDKVFVRLDFNLSAQPPADRPPQLHRGDNDIGFPTSTTATTSPTTSTSSTARPTRRSPSSTARSATRSTSCA